MAETTNEPVEELNDDELALDALADETIELSEDYGVFRQQDGLVAWTLQNFYREDGKIRSARELKADPPVLRIEDGTGESVDFTLTKEFTRTMIEMFDTVNLGIHGIKKNRSKWTSLKDAITGSILENPLKVTLVTVLVLFLFVFMIVK